MWYAMLPVASLSLAIVRGCHQCFVQQYVVWLATHLRSKLVFLKLHGVCIEICVPLLQVLVQFYDNAVETRWVMELLIRHLGQACWNCSRLCAYS